MVARKIVHATIKTRVRAVAPAMIGCRSIVADANQSEYELAH
jgi:hypothetical protein